MVKKKKIKLFCDFVLYVKKKKKMNEHVQMI